MSNGKGVKIEYLFCRNVECNAHATFIVGKHPPDSKFAVGETCPICQTGLIDQIDIGTVSKVPPSVGAVPTGVVLPGAPYGALVLRRGDEDASQTWGGVKVSDPRHDGAHYIAELQRDLLRLGHYGPARGGETLGRFGLQLMGCVLDFKRHLTRFHGVSANADAAQVNAGATLAGAAVHFPPQGLVSPGEVLRDAESWAKLLGRSRQNVPSLAIVRKWGQEWEKLRAVDAPRTVAEVDTLRGQAKADSSTTQRLNTERASAIQAQTRFNQRMARLEFPRRQGTLTEEQVAEAENLFDTMLGKINGVGNQVPELLARVRGMDARIPGATRANEPGTDDVVLTPLPPPGDTLGDRFDRMQEARTRAPS